MKHIIEIKMCVIISKRVAFWYKMFKHYKVSKANYVALV